MTVETKLPFDKEYIEQFSKERNEPEWMTSLRIDALERAEDLDMPDPDKTKITNWNFTDFKHAFTTGEAIPSVDKLLERLEEYFNTEEAPENLIIQRNNSAAFTSISDKLKEQGVIFTDIFTAINEHGDLFKQYFMKDAVSVDEHRLTALHTALVNGGVFIYVPENVHIEDPVQAVFWQEDNEISLVNHVLIVAEKNSSLTYVENYISDNDNEETVSNIISEVIVKENAKVKYGAVDNFANGTTTYVNRRGIAQADAEIEWALGQMNAGNTVSENITHLLGDRAVSNANAVSVGVEKQTQNFTASIVQHGQDTDGNISQRGVMKGKATAIFNAIGKIEDGGTRSNSEQESRILMLSDEARGDANPILLIDEDDVTAGHAASVGRIDPLQMYYLMSRGITKEEAERLIIHGFLAPVVSNLPIESVKNQLTQVIERKIV
jgi:Fe-S cluster assembly protein SufD